MASRADDFLILLAACNSYSLGEADLTAERYEKAIEHFKNSLKSFTEINQLEGVASTNCHLGTCCFRIGQYTEAIHYYEKGLQVSTEIGDRAGIASDNNNLGNVYYILGKHQKAIDYFKTSLEIETEIDNQLGIANTTSNLGNVYCRLGQFKEAIDYYKKSLELSTEIGDRPGIAMSNGNLGSAYRLLGEYKKAIEFYERSLALYTEIGDRIEIVANYTNLGNAYSSLGENQKAIGYYKMGLQISTEIGYRLGIAKNNGNLGSVYDKFGDRQKAIEYHKKALQIITEIGNKEGIANQNKHLGNAYDSLGEYGLAIEYYEKSLQIYTEIGDRSGIAICHGNLGVTYSNLGEHKKAIEYYKKSLQISTEIGDRSEVARNNGNLGNSCLNLGEYQKAIEYYEKGLQINTEIGHRTGIASNNGCLGSAYLSLGEYQKAIEYYEKGLQISNEIGNRSGIASINGSLGDAYFSLGEYQKAIEYHERGLQISIEIGDRSTISSINGKLGKTYQRLGQYDVGVTHLMKSVSLFDEIFLNFVPDNNKLEYTQQYFQLYLRLMSCFLAIGRIDSALLVVDLGRAKELHFCIEKQKNTVGIDVLDFAPAIWSQISAREERTQIEELRKVVRKGKTDISVLIFAFDMSGFLNVWVFHDQVIHIKLDESLITILFLVMQLSEPLNVRVGRNSSFCNTGSATSTHDELDSPSMLPNRKPGQAAKNAVHNAVGNLSNDVIDRNILEMLFQISVGSVKHLCKGNKLIIIPDRPLFFTPFSALVDENGRYLSESYSIQITPSLHSLKCSIEQSRNTILGYALFVGNPKVGNVSFNGKIFLPDDLPNAAKEVECLSKLFEATPLLESKARKEVVLKYLGGASLIHIAAHGEPTQGEILLAPNSNFSTDQPCPCVSKPESYLLTQRDIMSVSVKARLVVLCCCHTGQGKMSSEGVIGITRAFLAAGARSVLATLWPINDYATKEFMETFYAELSEEIFVCEALKRTMNVFQKHEKEDYRSIKIWAPFTIYGEDVNFKKSEIEEIKEKSREMFSDPQLTNASTIGTQ